MKARQLVPAMCLILLAAAQAVAGDRLDTPQLMAGADRLSPNGAFSWKRHITLGRITLRELAGAAPAHSKTSGLALSMGSYRGGAEAFGPPSITTTLVRTLPSLWRLRIPSPDSANAIDVTYEIEGANGHRNCLSHEDRPDSEILVTAQPIPPRLNRRNPHSALVEGGVIMYLDIANARTAGRYRGTLTVTVHQL